jgi:hypothetical protein
VSALEARRGRGEAPHVLMAVGAGGGKGSWTWAAAMELLAEGREVVVGDGKAPRSWRPACQADESWPASAG